MRQSMLWPLPKLQSKAPADQRVDGEPAVDEVGEDQVVGLGDAAVRDRDRERAAGAARGDGGRSRTTWSRSAARPRRPSSSPCSRHWTHRGRSCRTRRPWRCSTGSFPPRPSQSSVTWMTKGSSAPLARPARLVQVTTWPTAAQRLSLPSAWKVRPAGSVSVTVKPVDVVGRAGVVDGERVVEAGRVAGGREGRPVLGDRQVGRRLADGELAQRGHAERGDRRRGVAAGRGQSTRSRPTWRRRTGSVWAPGSRSAGREGEGGIEGVEADAGIGQRPPSVHVLGRIDDRACRCWDVPRAWSMPSAGRSPTPFRR